VKVSIQGWIEKLLGFRLNRERQIEAVPLLAGVIALERKENGRE